MDEIAKIITDRLAKPGVRAGHIVNDLKAAGFIIVPREPTMEMGEAGDSCDDNPEEKEWLDMQCGDYDWTEIGNADCFAHWNAMIAAWENTK